MRRLSLLLLATVLLVGCGLTKTELRMLLSDYRQLDVNELQLVFTEQSQLHFEEVPIVGDRNPLEALTSGEADLALIENSAGFVGGVRAVLPVFQSVLHLAASNKYEPSNRQTPLEGANFYVVNQSAAGIAFVQLITRRQNLGPDDYRLSYTYEEGSTDFIVYFGPIDPAFTAWMRPEFTLFSLDNALNRERAFYEEGITYTGTRLSPKTIPAFTYDLPGNEEPVLAMAVDTLLVTRKEIPEATVYELTKVLLEQKPRLASISPQLFSGINESFDPLDLSFPLHAGARAYLERDDPGFIERYAETINMLVYVSFLLISAFLGFARWREQKKKDRIDVFYERILAIRDESAGRSAGQRLAELDALEREAFTSLIREKLAANESFRIFTDLLATARSEIREGEGP